MHLQCDQLTDVYQTKNGLCCKQNVVDEPIYSIQILENYYNIEWKQMDSFNMAFYLLYVTNSYQYSFWIE